MSPAESANFKSGPPHRRETVAWMRGVSRYVECPGFVRVLTDVSFEVRPGEVFGLLGPSGSGKSTTIRILAGRLSPSEGKAKVFGRSPRRRSVRMRVGYVPQRRSHITSHLLAQAMGFLENLFFGGGRYPRSETSDVMVWNERRSILKQVLARNPDLLLSTSRSHCWTRPAAPR